MEPSQAHKPKAYLVGAGIASLAAAAFLIRDGGFAGEDIIILQQYEDLGGTLGASGDARNGYQMQDGRNFESRCVCTFDLFSSIPTLDRSRSVTEEIVAWNESMKTVSPSLLFRPGKGIGKPLIGLNEQHIQAIVRLQAQPEETLGRTTIAEHFDGWFFVTDFWFLWCATFAFQPSHSAAEFRRYLRRFLQSEPGINNFDSVMRTPLNRYDSLVRPLHRWLLEHGVQFKLNAQITNLDMVCSSESFEVQDLRCNTGEVSCELGFAESDLIFVTLGSMTECSSLGSMSSAARSNKKREEGAWHLWETLATKSNDFGNPANFRQHGGSSSWTSFTTTLRDPAFFNAMRKLTGNTPGEGGPITFPESNWLLSIVLPSQPHFLDQPADVQVFWGCGLFSEMHGNFVPKPMSACTGAEIMTEILGHLQLQVLSEGILATSTCLPCLMPYITSQFLPRSPGDRPDVVRPRSRNLALIGPFAELPDDVAFTVEYSIRSAQTAVYKLLRLDRQPPPVYHGVDDPHVLLESFVSLYTHAQRKTAATR